MSHADENGRRGRTTHLHLHDKRTALVLDRRLNRLDRALEAVDRGVLHAHVSAPPTQHETAGARTLSVAFVLRTYSGGATSFALIGTASVLWPSPARSAFLIASMPAGV